MKKSFSDLEKTKGDNYFKKKEFNKAVFCYTKSIEKWENLIVFSNRAISLIKMGKYEEAIEDCNHIIKEDPTFSKAFLRRG